VHVALFIIDKHIIVCFYSFFCYTLVNKLQEVKMAGKDDFFGDDSASGESGEASLDDFFQPAVTEPAPPPAPPEPSIAPPEPSAAPPPEPTPMPPEPEPSAPEPSPFPEIAAEPPPEPSLPEPSAPTESEIGETLFPMEKGAEPPPVFDDEPELSEEPAAEEAPKEPKPGLFARIPRLAIFITIGIIAGALIRGGGYFGYKYYESTKKKKSAKKEPVSVATSPVVPKETPAINGEPPRSVPAPVPGPKKKASRATSKKSGKKKTTAATTSKKRGPKKKIKKYTPKPLPKLPPAKRLVHGMWLVHLERLALEDTLAKDAEIIRKAGLSPFRVIERRATQLTEYRLVANFANARDAHAAAWKADKLGFRPKVGTSGRKARVTFSVSFSRNYAEKQRNKLAAKGISNIKVVKVRSSRKLQSLRTGPYSTEAEARNAAQKLKGSGFPNAMVMRS